MQTDHGGRSLEDRLCLLGTAPVLGGRQLALGSNGTFLIRIAAPGPLRLAVYKPRRGESPLWDFPHNDLYRREEAAYVLASLFGWDFIPETVIRDGPFGTGSAQRFIPGARTVQAIGQEHVAPLIRMVAFDEIANNADRKATHLLLDRKNRLWGIDHGLCFHTEFKMRTGIAAVAGRPIPDWLRRELSPVLAEPEGLLRLRGTLASRLQPDEADACAERGQRLLERGQFLPFNPRRVPWGW
jgi:hypothetical protein